MHTTLSLHTHNLNGRQTYSSSYESGGGPSEIVTVLLLPKACILDILFPSNHNIHKSSSGLCFWPSDTLTEGV